MATNIPDVRYLACWTEDDGIYSCGHEHETIADAMKCLVPDGRSFLRACESGMTRSLTEVEVSYFLVALGDMPWRSSEESKKVAEVRRYLPPRFSHPRDRFRSWYRLRFQ